MAGVFAGAGPGPALRGGGVAVRAAEEPRRPQLSAVPLPPVPDVGGGRRASHQGAAGLLPRGTHPRTSVPLQRPHTPEPAHPRAPAASRPLDNMAGMW